MVARGEKVAFLGPLWLSLPDHVDDGQEPGEESRVFVLGPYIGTLPYLAWVAEGVSLVRSAGG